MRRSAILVVLLAVAAGVNGPAHAIYSLSNEGQWPQSWPADLEPFRKQARTLEGPMTAHRHYAIRFADRAEFGSVWSQILKLKSAGAPVFLVRGENFFLGEGAKAGVVIHCPPDGPAKNPRIPEAPIAGVTNSRMRWVNTTTIELVVDGEVVDLNRILLPADTPIVDERFDEAADGQDGRGDE